MKITYHDFIHLFNNKRIYSRFSDKEVTFVEEITAEIKAQKKGVFSTLIYLLDYDGKAEDDIQSMYAVCKDGTIINMEDFFSIHNAYGDKEAFYNAAKQIIADR